MTVSMNGSVETHRDARSNGHCEFAGRRVLITGATGFIGMHLVRAVRERGAFVRALVRNAIRARSLPRDVDRRYGCLGDRELPIGLADDIDLVFHLGAAIGGGWDDHERATIRGTRNLLKMCRDAGVRRFVHVSSVAAHETAHLRDGDSLRPEAPLTAHDTQLGNYARGKAEAERAVRAFADNSGLPWTIVRPGLVYGPGHIVFEHLGRNVRGTFVGMGNRDLLLPLVSIESVIDALLRVAVEPEAVGRAYIVVDENMPRSEYIRMLGEAQGRAFRQFNVPLWTAKALAGACQVARRTTGVRRIPDMSVAKVRSRGLSLRLDSAALRRDTGWAPACTVNEGLRVFAKAERLERTGPVRVGIVGAGNVARMHVAALRRIPGLQIVGVVDPSPNRAGDFAKELNIGVACDTAAAFYEEARPDVVHVLTPPATHCAAGIAAFERGVHVLCEKPLALTVAECNRMVQAARANGVLLCANHNYLFDERVAAARRTIDTGGIGELRHVDIFWGFDVRRLKHFTADLQQRSHWAYRMPGGLLEDLAPHPLSMLTAFLGPDARVAHSTVRDTGRIARGIDEELRLALESDRATGNLTLSLTARPDDFTVTLYGTHAAIRLDLQDMLICRTRLGKGPKPIARGLKVGRANLTGLAQLALNPALLATGRALPPADPLPLLRAFYNALQGKGSLPVSTEDAAKVVEIIRTVWPAAGCSATESPEYGRSAAREIVAARRAAEEAHAMEVSS